MTDSCMYEFEDNVWDEFCRSDDHIVPNPCAKHADDDPALDDSHKKPRREVTTISSNSGDKSAAECIDPQREHKKESSILASDNTMTSTHGFKSNNTGSNSSEKCSNDSNLDCKTTAVGDESFSYPLDDMTQTNNQIDFFENTEDRESSDLLYYGWSEIGNFEDVDRMFRSCDSTFGLGASNEDEMGWLSTADNMGGSGDALKSDFMFPCPEKNAVENIHESAMTSAHDRYKDSSWISENSDSYLSFVTGPAIADSKDGLDTKEQGMRLDDLSRNGNSGMINDRKKELKPKNQSMGKRKEKQSENGSFGYMSNLTDEATQFPPGGTSHQAYPPVCMQQQLQQQAFGADSYSYLQNPLAYAHSDSSQFSNQTLNPRPAAVKHETNEPAGNKKRDRAHNHQGLNSSLKTASTVVHASICSPRSNGLVSVDKVDTEGVLLPIPSELGSSDAQENLMMSSGLDDTSAEAASFHQLQLVMGQLDLRTKLCIRDSLYRLARSAEQRHTHANLNRDDRDASGAFMAEGTNNFMDIETDTNPIDRSIAHLLFHRPSESSAMPSAVRGSVTNPPVAQDNMVVCDIPSSF